MTIGLGATVVPALRVIGVVGLIGLVAGMAVTLALIGRVVRAWGYALSADILYIRQGPAFPSVMTAVPYARLQFVDLTAGPLDRRFGLASMQAAYGLGVDRRPHSRASGRRRRGSSATR